MSDPTTPGGRPEDEPARGVPDGEGLPGETSSGAPEPVRGVPDGEGLPGAATADQRRGTPDGDGLPGGEPPKRGGLLATWKRTYGASPAHLLLHLAAIALCAWALAQSFDARYEAVYKNLAIWMVGGAILNDFVALPLYVGIDRIARTAWGAIRGAGSRARGDAGERSAPLVPGNGHVRFPVVMSAVLLLVYGPNILRDTGRGYALTTGLAEPPDYASRWLIITAGLLIASAVIYGLRVAAARSAARRPSAP